MADTENKKEEVKKEEKTTKKSTQSDVKKETKKEEKKPEVKKEKKKEEKKSEVKKETKKEDKKPEVKDVKVEKKEDVKKEAVKPETKKFEVSKQKVVNKEKKTNNNTNKITGIITVVIVLAIVAVLTVLIVTSSDPKKSVDGFLTNLKSGDFAKAQEFVVGDKILENQQYTEDTQKLLFDKISWKVKKTTTENDKASVEVEITNKDFAKITENSMKKILSNLKAKTVLQGNISNNDIEKYFEEELKNDNVQMKTETRTIELQKQDGKWKVVANEELENTLLPGLQDPVNNIN